ncbi:MAG: sulfatase-like hydrolase/transferase [Alphaproteobacteria bacterium]|nr:sulfatase-like hydrolase/transferase [Alphaproteobacteria bacterium]
MPQSDPKSNLLIVCADQLRADFLGCYGHPTIGTRHIDALARASVRFANAYVASPSCGPSRISLATSTYVGEHGHRDYGSMISPDVPNLVTSLRSAGYRTAMFGKNHMFHYERLLEVWDELHEVTFGNYDFHPSYDHAWRAFSLEEGHTFNRSGALTEEAMAFMARAKDAPRPFLCWLNYQDPHPAFCAPPPYDTLFDPAEVALPASWSAPVVGGEPVRNAVWRAHSEMELCDEAEIRRSIAMYMGQIRYIDDCVGRLMACLEETGLAARTAVFFLSDHGEHVGYRRMTHKNPTFYEAMTRQPAILRLPGGARGEVFEGLVEEVDFAPTILGALDVEIPPSMVGKDWSGALDSPGGHGREDVLVECGVGAPTWETPIEGVSLWAPFSPTDFGPGAMLRYGDWKLSVYHDDACELFNLAEDPEELVNRFEDPDAAEIRNALMFRLAKRLLAVKVREVGAVQWPANAGIHDVRREPLERDPRTRGLAPAAELRKERGPFDPRGYGRLFRTLAEKGRKAPG